MSSKDEKDKSPTDTISVPDAEPRWSLGASLGVDPLETTTVKCSTCKVPTLHEWGMINPKPLFHTEDMIEIASKRRRLIMCTNCGLVKTIT